VGAVDPAHRAALFDGEGPEVVLALECLEGEPHRDEVEGLGDPPHPVALEARRHGALQDAVAVAAPMAALAGMEVGLDLLGAGPAG